jgi:hypothetical protein
MESSPNDAAQRDVWEQQADNTRAKLVITLGELDRRRHELFDVRKMLARHKKEIALVVGAAALVTLAAAAFVARRKAARPRRLRRHRITALQRAWAHPELVAPKSRGFWYELGRRVALTAAESIGVKALERLLEQPATAAHPPTPELATPST